MVNISYTTIITAIFFFCLFCICILGYIRKKGDLFHKKEVVFLLIMFSIIGFRLIFPIELPITKSVYISSFYTDFCDILKKPILQNIPFFELLFLISITISLLIALVKFSQYRKCYLFFKQATVVKTISVSTCFKREKQIPIVKSSFTEEPFILGILKPRIVIPYTKFSNEDYIIQHEIQHYLNHDLFFKLCIEVLVILFWWNPLLYLLRHHVGNLLELKNDFSVTGHLSKKEKIDYAETLIFAAKEKNKKKHFGLGISSTSGFLKIRIHSLFAHSPFRVSPFLLLTFLLTIFSYFIVIEPYSRPDLGPTGFLLEDVSYLEKNEDGTYTIYVNEEPIGTLSNIPDDWEHVKIIEKR